MNGWLLAAIVLLLGGLLPCLLAMMRGRPVSRLLALDLAAVITVLELVLLAQGFSRSTYLELALVLALLAFAGTLVFARFVGRTL